MNLPRIAGIAAQAGQGAEEIAEVVEDTPPPEVGMPNPSLPVRYEGPPTPFPEPMELGGSASTRSRDLDDSGRPAKQAKVSAPAQQIMAAMEIDLEDEPNLTQFLDEELDYMENYDYNIEDEQMTDENFEGKLESMLDRLSKPYSKEEPMMDTEELQGPRQSRLKEMMSRPSPPSSSGAGGRRRGEEPGAGSGDPVMW